MRTTLLPLFLLGSAVAEPLLCGLHVIRQEQEGAAHEAEFADQLSATTPAEGGATPTEPRVTRTETGATAPDPSTAPSDGTAVAEVGHEALYFLGDGTLAMNISIGTPLQHVLVALSFDRNSSDLYLTTVDTSAPANVTKRGAPIDEVINASKKAVDAADESGNSDANPDDSVDAVDSMGEPKPDNPVRGGDTTGGAAVELSKQVLDASKEAMDSSKPALNGTEVLVSQEGLFNPGQSSTFQKGNQTSGTDVSQGTIAADTVTVGTVSIVDQPFILQGGLPSDAVGALSLGRRGDDESLGNLPLYRALATHWPAQEMGLFVASKSDATLPLENAGELTLGGLNPALYEGDMMFLPVHKDHWALRFTHLSLNFEPIMVNGTYAVDDIKYNAAEGVTPRRRQVEEGPVAALWFRNGSLLDPELSDKLLAGIPGSIRTTTGAGTEYSVPCETNAALTFTLAGYNFSLTPEDWIYRIPSSDGGCATYFKPITDAERQMYGYGPETLIVFGLNALRTVYTAFRFGNGTEAPQIGFAKLSPAAFLVVPTPVGQGPAVPIPGASQGPVVTGTGAGPQPSAPVSKPSAAPRATASVGFVFVAIALTLAIL
ncbi:hypothetical protein CspeluHIS016_0501420 [Cutaneotrichosporon spelunceum]|uniref:Peptidase A1 domain-containing protein n=1 Tax=Cutaneotrichosporon spelunceum TaxID=1672016 RepID=A0AAD3TW99_9TREE|nr:hypothetical protein CspeluHIS016_0501420 [Cutaneotrichosporon spelunceum]